jgi:hydroxypyruvate isomerase
MGLVGHVQVADMDGRHEPGTGKLDWPGILKLLRDKGYSGDIGLEYLPTMATAASIQQTRRALGLS